jgi:hypothetical protein
MILLSVIAAPAVTGVDELQSMWIQRDKEWHYEYNRLYEHYEAIRIEIIMKEIMKNSKDRIPIKMIQFHEQNSIFFCSKIACYISIISCF